MLREDLKNEFNSLVPGQTTEQGATRRTALKVALGVGYAATAMPIMAQTAIKTSAEGLKTGETSYDVGGFKVPAYFAAPAGKTNLPVVLVVQEIFGVHEYIADTAAMRISARPNCTASSAPICAPLRASHSPTRPGQRLRK